MEDSTIIIMSALFCLVLLMFVSEIFDLFNNKNNDDE